MCKRSLPVDVVAAHYVERAREGSGKYSSSLNTVVLRPVLTNLYHHEHALSNTADNLSVPDYARARARSLSLSLSLSLSFSRAVRERCRERGAVAWPRETRTHTQKVPCAGLLLSQRRRLRAVPRAAGSPGAAPHPTPPSGAAPRRSPQGQVMSVRRIVKQHLDQCRWRLPGV